MQQVNRLLNFAIAFNLWSHKFNHITTFLPASITLTELSGNLFFKEFKRPKELLVVITTGCNRLVMSYRCPAEKRGQPKTTWQRTMMKELEEWGLTWSEAHTRAQDKVEWSGLVMVLCTSRDEEVEWMSVEVVINDEFWFTLIVLLPWHCDRWKWKMYSSVTHHVAEKRSYFHLK